MNKLLDCLNNKNSSYIPIWFMRQAGRYLPEFREIRRENKDFVKLCLNSKLAKDVTLQPMKRFDLDAAIIFSDILMIPYGLGQSLEFKKGFGPSLGNLDFEKNIKVSTQNFVERLSPVYEAIKLTKKDIKDKSVIGFVGAPWTLLVYMLNKQSPKKDFNLNLLIKDQTLSRKLIEMLEEKVCLHAKKQIEAGADVIQIFDSWAGLLPEKELTNYCFSPTKKLLNN